MPNGRRIANETQAHVPQRLTPTGWLPGRLKAALRAELENLRTENKMMRLACVLSKKQPIRDGRGGRRHDPDQKRVCSRRRKACADRLNE
jgi:hypothetical protein